MFGTLTVENRTDTTYVETQDVGIWAERREGRNGDCIARPQTYLTLNGLSEDNDAVLGDYKIWVTGGRSTTWTITARSGGELLWVNGGVFSEFQEETETFTATVTSYAESDCTVDEYGERRLGYRIYQTSSRKMS